MNIRTISFNPLVVMVDGVVAPVIESSYQDEDGNTQVVTYVVANGEKKVIKHRVEIFEHLETEKTVDEALVKVEVARLKKIEDSKLQEELQASTRL